jgi:HAE1 family hydrophobic/amphiphilic exporter-1
MISKFFIERPVLANVLAVLVVLIGGVALFTLPVAQYPNITPPTVQVTTRYPGASAETLVNSVALPIELSVNGVDRMIYMQSTSSPDGSYVLTVTFEIGTDLNYAEVLVQNRVATTLSQLPQAVQAQGVQVQARSTAILQIVTLTSPDGRFDSLFLSNFATLNLLNGLARIPGVGNVNVFGVGQYAMRIWLDPGLLAARSLTPQDVIKAVQQQSQQVAGGQVGAPPAPQGQNFQYTVNVAGRLVDAAQFGAIVVKSDGGNLTRVADVGRVELGAQTYSQALRLNDAAGAGLSIFLTPDANALEVAGRVRAKLTELAHNFPPGVTYAIPFDTTRFVRASIDEVYRTLIEAAVLVLVVILLFLQDWRATLVPATTVPVTIIGAFAVMAALGFSVNLSTLFAIVLAIGIVVDDAIVVVEGAAHRIEQGETPHDAAVAAMHELFGPIIGITLALMAVFMPAAFLPGLTGRMYAQFALVIAATALISAINAATLKPAQCALWLRPAVPPEERNFVFRAFNRLYDPIERAYGRLIGRMAGRAKAMAATALILAALGVWSIVRLPTGFIPTEDQGYLVVALQLPDGASLERTQSSLAAVGRIARDIPAVDQVIEIAGISALDSNASLPSAGVAYVILKDWGARGPGERLRNIYDRLQAALGTLADGNALVVPPPPIQGVGNSNGFTMAVELRDGSFDWPRLRNVTRALVANASSQTALQHVASPFRTEAPQIDIAVDRTKAETAHVSVGDVFNALAGYVGSSYINQFNSFGRTFTVYAQADARFRVRPNDLEALKVRSTTGQMVPLGALVTMGPRVGPALVTLYDLYPAAIVIGLPAAGFSSGEAIALMEDTAARVLPPGTGFDWSAMAYQEKVAGGQIYIIFVLALLLVYLCLAGQYESWIAPLSVLLSVPLALLGPGLVLGVLGLANNLYTQIGVMLLIALAAKNAILIIEVARAQRSQGLAITAAATTAARMRFRPILMTSFAFILGVMPLVGASGAGAAARVSLGIAVVSGMLASTCLTVLFAPSFFVVLQSIEERVGARRREPATPGRRIHQGGSS